MANFARRIARNQKRKQDKLYREELVRQGKKQVLDNKGNLVVVDAKKPVRCNTSI